MSTNTLISACRETDQGFSWIRCEGKGSFLNSPVIKEWAEDEIDEGVSKLVVDLAECTGMDSTFMGTLAGLAMRLAKVEGGNLSIAEPGEKNRKSLEELGLTALLDIDPSNAPWREQVDDIRSHLETVEQNEETNNAAHCLEAHKKLCVADSANTEKFRTVIDFLQSENGTRLANKK